MTADFQQKLPDTEGRRAGRGTFIGPTLWLASGNIIYGLSQVVLVAVLARTHGPSVVGSFTLATAIIVPVIMLSDMNLRVLVATDPARRIKDSDYRGVRERGILLAAVVCVALGLILGPTRTQLPLFLGVLAYKVADSLSDLSYGFAFREERGSEVGRAMMLRGVLSAVVGTTLLLFLGNAALAVSAIAVGWLLLAFREWRYFGLGRFRLKLTPLSEGAASRVGRKGGYLGVAALVSSLHHAMPRYYIAGISGTHELGIYGAVSTMANGLAIVAGSAVNILLPRLTRFHQLDDRKDFWTLLRTMVAYAAIVLLPIVILSGIVGDEVAGWLLGPEYARASIILALVAAVSLNFLGQLMAKALQAAQAFRTYLITDLTASFVTAVTLVPATRAWGTAGAGWAIGIGSLARLALVLFLLIKARNEVQR